MIILMQFLVVLSGVFGIQSATLDSASSSRGVELGIVELSPNGESGGYAMPASGCSVVHTVATCAFFDFSSCTTRSYIHECATPPPVTPVTPGIPRIPRIPTTPGTAPPPISCNSSANYCGAVDSGTRPISGGACSAVRPLDTTCINLPLDPNTGLVLVPSLVRKGSQATLRWDLGLNYPPVCTLTGKGLETFTFGPEDRTGSTIVTVSGPHRYTLTCGTSRINKDVRVLPALYES